MTGKDSHPLKYVIKKRKFKKKGRRKKKRIRMGFEGWERVSKKVQRWDMFELMPRGQVG